MGAVVEARDRFEAESRGQLEELASSADRLRIMEAKMHVLEASRQVDEQQLRDEHAAELVLLNDRCGVLASEVEAKQAESHRAAEFIESELLQATSELRDAQAQLQETRSSAETHAEARHHLEAQVSEYRSEVEAYREKLEQKHDDKAKTKC